MGKSKEELIEATGTVTKAERGAFIVTLDTGHPVRCHLGGKLRKNFIRVTPGDRVRIEITPYNLNQGRIVFRDK